MFGFLFCVLANNARPADKFIRTYACCIFVPAGVLCSSRLYLARDANHYCSPFSGTYLKCTSRPKLKLARSDYWCSTRIPLNMHFRTYSGITPRANGKNGTHTETHAKASDTVDLTANMKCVIVWFSRRPSLSFTKHELARKWPRGVNASRNDTTSFCYICVCVCLCRTWQHNMPYDRLRCAGSNAAIRERREWYEHVTFIRTWAAIRTWTIPTCHGFIRQSYGVTLSWCVRIINWTDKRMLTEHWS